MLQSRGYGHIAHRQISQRNVSAACTYAAARVTRASLLGPFEYVTSEGFLPAQRPDTASAPRTPSETALHGIIDRVPAWSMAAPGALRAHVLRSLHDTPSLLPDITRIAAAINGASCAPDMPMPSELPAAEEAAAAWQLWELHYLLSFVAHAYMWCDSGPPPGTLPAALAVPWANASAAVGMLPVLTYATYNLLNYRVLEPTQLPRLGNLACRHNFLGGVDEEWFRHVHVEVEALAGPCVAAAPLMQAAALQGQAEEVLHGLQRMRDCLAAMQATLNRMGEHCDPYIYYTRVRRPMSGWRGNPGLPGGLVYEGVSPTPRALYGETGAQSSILPTFDAVLGIQHEEVWLRDYLDAMLLHMPHAHQRHVRQLREEPASSAVRAMAMQGPPEVLEAYNEAVEQLEKFRAYHKSFAYSYIAKWARAEAQAAQGVAGEAGAARGTGGSDFMPALSGYQRTTQQHRL